MSRKHQCDVCGTVAWRVAAGPCFVDFCPGKFKALPGAKLPKGTKLCAYCGEEFTPRRVTDNTCCRKCSTALYRETSPKCAKVKSVETILLGPANPPRCKHVCAGYPGHKCKVRTPDRRCDDCKRMWLFSKGYEMNVRETCYDECPV